MNKFLTFETTSLKLNNSVFPCNAVSFDINADTTNVYDIDGIFIGTAPNSPIQGQCSMQFYLTGALPNFLKAEYQSETPIRIQFNNFFIPSAYLSNLNFSVAPFQPVAVSANFMFYHGLSVLDMNHKNWHDTYSSSLPTSNGLTSYIVTSNRDSYNQNPNNFIATDFNYSFTVDRQPVLRVRESIPSRVAMKQINAEMEVSANNLDGRLKIYGTNAIFNAVLRDSQNPSVSSSLDFTGVINGQGYSISESSYGLAKIKLTQTINRRRSILSIPFEEEDNSLTYAPPTTIEYAEIPVEDIPAPPPNNPPIIVNGIIAPPTETPFIVKIAGYYLTSTELDAPSCIDGGYFSSLQSINVSYTNSDNIKYSVSRFAIPGENPITSFSKYDSDYSSTPSPQIYDAPPYYFAGAFAVNKNLKEYVAAASESEINDLANVFPYIEILDQTSPVYGTNFGLYTQTQNRKDGYDDSGNQICENDSLSTRGLSWNAFLLALKTAIAAHPTMGEGTVSSPYVIVLPLRSV